MWKVSCFVIFLLVAAGDSQAQHAQPAVDPALADAIAPNVPVAASAALPPLVRSAAGAAYFIESRAAQPVRKRSARSANVAPSRLVLEALAPDQLAVLEKLNRVDASRLRRLNRLIVPAAWADDELAYSPFPQDYPWAASKAQMMVVDQAAQAFGAYEYGRLVRWGPVSTGEGGKTPAGLFELSWRSRGHTSSEDPSWYLEWYFNFIPSRGIAFHKYSLPGRAGSHGCVRMLERDAQWLYGWGQTRRRDVEATTVIVLGCPDASKPWQSEDFLRGGIALPAVPPSGMMDCTGSSGPAAASLRNTVR
jgi:lipoprotein-anchoring transpeptidase ErfK/SrfK